MSKHDKKPLTAIVGATFVTTLSAGVVNAAENPFSLKELNSGYMHVAEAEAAKEKKEMTCGEGKCGAEMMKKPEMKCGAGMKEMQEKAKVQEQKAIEMKCAGMKMEAAPQPPASTNGQ